MELFYPLDVLNCRGFLLDIRNPVVMGILNVTPDSFYDGGIYTDDRTVLRRVDEMVAEGVRIIDIGAESTRPGAQKVSVEEQISRLKPYCKRIVDEYPEVFVSIDANEAEVVKYALDQGVHLVNNVSAAYWDQDLIGCLRSFEVPYVCMHMQNQPHNMQSNPSYEDVVQEVLDFFITQVGRLRKEGVYDVILDPGFGFGKSIRHNYQILNELDSFKILELPVLVGISRKSMVTKVIDSSAENALSATSALHLAALDGGAKILRVHDVKEAHDVIKVWTSLQEARNE